MTLFPGTRLGAYEVTAAIGAGGMGEVFRARDTKLDRDVAIKVLPSELAQDRDRLARFEREAKLLASLNHPNIAHVYGFEGASLPDGSTAHFLAMELVEGEDLSQRLKRGAIPVDESIAIAKQIAEALEEAHEHGIIHRDLKPANVKVTPDGKVKVLDFGLAKALEGDPSKSGASSQMSHSPTMSRHMTEAGMIMGTAAYMSPEQARGKTVDKRADIWSFGVVLFEMLTGTRLFAGETVSDTLASVLREEVPWNRLPKDTPPHVTLVLKRCLTRDAHDRLRDIGDARMALMGAFETLAPQAAGASRGPLAWKAAFAVAALMAVALAVPAVKHLRELPPATRTARLTLGIAPADRLGPAEEMGRPSRTAFAVSHDGGTVVFSGETTAPGSRPTTRLYRRPLAEAEAVAIPGTEGASYPFFSPDGQWVGFAAGNTLKKVALSGGPPIALCDSAGGIGGASWGSAGVIAFASRGLWTVSESGGKPEAAVEAGPGTVLNAPAMLPDGQTVLFTEESGDGRWENAHVDAINLATKQRTTLLTNAADARYSPTGHLVFMRNAALLAVPFDATRVAVTGAAVPLLAGVMQSTNATNSARETGMGQFALSASGMLLYAAGERYPTLTSTLVRVDRKGAETALAEIKANLGGLRLSPSGTRVVAYKTGDGSRAIDVWTYDLPSGTPTRLTSTGDASWPLFSPDGTSVMFFRSGSPAGSYALPLNGSTAPQRLIEEKAAFLGASWSPDGKWLASLQRDGVSQIFVRAMRDGRPDAGEPRQFSLSTFNQRDAHFSPDGRWIAYSSDESGASEVYVQPFPGPGEKRRLSSSGGANPAWSRSGRELFFLVRPVPERPDVAMMSVEVSTGGDFKASAPRVLFEGPYGTTSPLRSYDVTTDGHFIMSRRQPPPDQPVTTLQVVLGWAEELLAKVPRGK